VNGSTKWRLFQIGGPATEKARFCSVEVRAKGTWEDLVELSGESGSYEHLVWGNIAQQDMSEQGKTTPYQCSHPTCIFNSLPSGEPVQDVAHITRDMVIFSYARI